MKECLWGLSNLVADSDNCAAAFFNQPDLMNKVMQLIKGTGANYNIRGEACWVISNAITIASKQVN